MNVIGRRDVFGNATSAYCFSTLTSGRNLRVRFLFCFDSYALVIYIHIVSLCYHFKTIVCLHILETLLLSDIFGCAFKKKKTTYNILKAQFVAYIIIVCYVIVYLMSGV